METAELEKLEKLEKPELEKPEKLEKLEPEKLKPRFSIMGTKPNATDPNRGNPGIS